MYNTFFFNNRLLKNKCLPKQPAFLKSFFFDKIFIACEQNKKRRPLAYEIDQFLTSRTLVYLYKFASMDIPYSFTIFLFTISKKIDVS